MARTKSTFARRVRAVLQTMGPLRQEKSFKIRQCFRASSIYSADWPRSQDGWRRLAEPKRNVDSQDKLHNHCLLPQEQMFFVYIYSPTYVSRTEKIEFSSNNNNNSHSNKSDGSTRLMWSTKSKYTNRVFYSRGWSTTPSTLPEQTTAERSFFMRPIAHVLRARELLLPFGVQWHTPRKALVSAQAKRK